VVAAIRTDLTKMPYAVCRESDGVQQQSGAHLGEPRKPSSSARPGSPIWSGWQCVRRRRAKGCVAQTCIRRCSCAGRRTAPSRRTNPAVRTRTWLGTVCRS